MSRVQGLRLALLMAAVGAAAALSGCGKQGVLEQPPPLFGARAKAAYQAQRAQEAKDDAQRSGQPSAPAAGANQQQGPGGTGPDNAPITTRDIQDPSQKQTPASAAPIAGAPPPITGPVQTRPNF